MASNIGLYFPYFHFPNDRWVKLAALYWDKMARIIPDGYVTERDTDIVKAFAENQLFIVNEPPRAELESIKIEFLKLVTTHKKELVRLYGIDNRFEWSDNKYTVTYAPAGANPKLAYIYMPKIENELAEFLFRLRLGTTRSDNGADFKWIGMHPKLANVYMAALAETMAKSRGANPVAYDSDNYFAVNGFTFERLASILLEGAKITSNTPSNEEIESALATIAIRTVIPKNIESVPVDKILRIRADYPGQMHRFQTFVQNIVNELTVLKSVDVPEFQHYHLEVEYNKQIKPQLDGLEEAMKLNGVDAVSGILNLEVKTPALLLGAGGLVGATLLDPSLGATAAVAIGLLKIIGDKSKAYKKALSESDVAYLMHVQEDLTPIASLEWLTSRARWLIYGV